MLRAVNRVAVGHGRLVSWKNVYSSHERDSVILQHIKKDAARFAAHRRWYGRIAVLALAYLMIVVAFCAVLFVNFYPISSFFTNALTPSTRIFDRNGILLYESLNPDAGRTQIVSLDEHRLPH